METFTLLLEGMCVRNLRTYAEALDGEVFHYRDKTGVECDAVIHLKDGRYGLVEVNLSGDRLIEEGVANLKKLAGKLDTSRMKLPSFLIALTGVGAYSSTARWRDCGTAGHITPINITYPEPGFPWITGHDKKRLLLFSWVRGWVLAGGWVVLSI